MPAISLGNAAAGGFGYPFPSNLWPVTEAEGSNDFFVVEFDGSGNETGAGFGMSGSALDLTAVNAPPAAVGGWRQIQASTHQGFKPTAALLDAWYNSANAPRGFGALYHLKNVSAGSDGSYLFQLFLKDVSSNELLELRAANNYGNNYTITFRLRAGPDGGTPLGISQTIYVVNKFPSSDEFWLAYAFREAVGNLPAYAIMGWKAGSVQPGGFGDCDHYVIYTPPVEEASKGDFAQAYGHDRAAAISILSDSAESIVGNEWVSSDTAGFYIKSLTLGRVPFGEL